MSHPRNTNTFMRLGVSYIPVWLSEAGATRGRTFSSPFPERPRRCELSPGRALNLPVAFAAAGSSVFCGGGDESGSSIDANECAAGDRRISVLPGKHFNGGGEGEGRLGISWLAFNSVFQRA